MNRLVVGYPLLVAAACTHPVEPRPDTLPPAAELGHGGGFFTMEVPGPVVRGRTVSRSWITSPRSKAAEVSPRLEGFTFDRSLGAELLAAIEELPPDRAAYGVRGLSPYVSAVPPEEGGLCETPRLTKTIQHGGQSWEVTLRAPSDVWGLRMPEPEVAPLSEACVAGLADQGLSSDDCTDAEARAHFPEGSTCLACLEVDGDHARCVTDEACPEEAQVKIRAGRWYDQHRMPVLTCAPDLVADMLVLVDEDNGPLDLYDHSPIGQLCFEGYSEQSEEMTLFCGGAAGAGHAIGDVLLGNVQGIARAGGSGAALAERLFTLDAIEVDGQVFEHIIAYENGAAAISAPNVTIDGWGLNPMLDGPGGWDLGRAYLAALALKTSTTITGIIVMPQTHNRCTRWSEPGADGSSDCEEVGGWFDEYYGDGVVTWFDQAAGSVYTFPIVTLAGTGLPDPTVPGGVVTEVIGSTTLADPQWDGCAWPTTFEPDRMRMLDPLPADGGEPYASFDAQTFRFGRADHPDVIMALASSQKRGFCFEPMPE